MNDADEARRIAPPESYGTLCNEIAAALAAAERRGIERAFGVVSVLALTAACYGKRDRLEVLLEAKASIRALLHESSGISGELPAEPAAKCAIPYCVDGFVPGPPNGEPEGCPSCGGGS